LIIKFFFRLPKTYKTELKPTPTYKLATSLASSRSLVSTYIKPASPAKESILLLGIATISLLLALLQSLRTPSFI
jgi:hypothetical protein